MKIVLRDLLKQRLFILLVIFEVLLLMGGFLSLFGKKQIYTYDIPDVTLAAGESYSVNDVSLPKGTYLVELGYSTNVDYSNVCEVTFDHMGYKAGYCNAVSLFSGKDKTSHEMWVLRDSDRICVTATATEGTLQLRGLEIHQTHASDRINLFVLCCLVVLVNSLYAYGWADVSGRITTESKIVGCLLIGVVLLASIPIMVDYIISSGDIGYHLMRIEGLKDGLLSGQFPVRVAPNWQQGNGYASAMFYCELFLLPAALLRMIGFTVTTSYRIYMLVMNVATVLISYFAFTKLFKSRYIGVFCSALYTLSLYRFVMSFVVGGLGETCAMLFLPLFVLGFYQVFCEDVKKKSYSWSNIPLVIAFAGMICSHLLGGELVGGFTILLCVLAWKRTLVKERFFALAKTVIAFLLLTAWFWVPFADYMLTGDFIIHHVSGRTIQERGLYLAHLFNPVFFAGGEVFVDRCGMQNSLPMGVGIGLIIVFVCWFVVAFVLRRECESHNMFVRDEWAMGNVLSFFAALSLMMSLNVFPWNYLQSMNGIFASLISSLQRPYRMLTIANVLLVGLAGLLAKVLARAERKWLRTAFVSTVAGASVFVTLFVMSHTMFNSGFVRIYNAEGMGTGYISGAEYLPFGVDAAKLTYHDPIPSEQVMVEGFSKGALSRELSCYNMSAEDGNVAVDLLYYKGFKAVDIDTRKELEVYAGENGLVTVKIPGGYQGIVAISFASPWYWRVAEIVSVISAVLIFLAFRKNKKCLLQKKED